jgi:hypothetical protein
MISWSISYRSDLTAIYCASRMRICVTDPGSFYRSVERMKNDIVVKLTYIYTVDPRKFVLDGISESPSHLHSIVNYCLV